MGGVIDGLSRLVTMATQKRKFAKTPTHMSIGGFSHGGDPLGMSPIGFSQGGGYVCRHVRIYADICVFTQKSAYLSRHLRIYADICVYLRHGCG